MKILMCLYIMRGTKVVPHNLAMHEFIISFFVSSKIGNSKEFETPIIITFPKCCIYYTYNISKTRINASNSLFCVMQKSSSQI